MAFAGFGKTQIAYDMFDMARDAEQARRFSKCENIYHKGQQFAWDGTGILQELLAEHGGIHLDEEKSEALRRVFAIIMWGELAAWKISLQLADGIKPLEAKMAATSQAFDEARHFYVMHDYLTELGYEPKRMDRAPQALLDLTLDTKVLAHKLLGMQLMIEPMALTIFQAIRQTKPEPVIAELMKYYERDEARHVGLGMQYLPEMIRGMSKRELRQMMLFQAQIMFFAVWEMKILEPSFRALGLDAREVIQFGRSKQFLALKEVYEALGRDMDSDKSLILGLLNAVNEVLYPTEETRDDILAQFRAAWEKLNEDGFEPDADGLAQHHLHTIKTASGEISEGDTDLLN